MNTNFSKEEVADQCIASITMDPLLGTTMTIMVSHLEEVPEEAEEEVVDTVDLGVRAKMMATPKVTLAMKH